jgi:hypothetical protein
VFPCRKPTKSIKGSKHQKGGILATYQWTISDPEILSRIAEHTVSKATARYNAAFVRMDALVNGVESVDSLWQDIESDRICPRLRD